MDFFVYILWSDKLHKFYVGSTNDAADRLHRHNSGQEKFTSKGVPWVLVHQIELTNRTEAYNLERKIKSRGIRRWLDDGLIAHGK